MVEADLGTARCAVVHRRVAAALEADPAGTSAELLAYHYSRSGQHDKAVLYLERAGDQAEAVFAHREAERHYRTALELARERGDHARAAETLEKLGAVLGHLARYDEALGVLQQAVEMYRAVADLESVARVSARIGRVYAERGTPEEGVAVLQPLLESVKASGAWRSGRSVAAMYAALARLYFASGRYSEQLATAERAAHFAGAVGDERILAEAKWVYGLALVMVEHVAEAHRILQEAIALAEKVSDLDTLCHALNLVGCIHEGRGEFDASRRYTERAYEVAERRGDPVQIAFMTTRRGMSAFLTGDWSQARVDYERAVALSRQIGASWGSMYPLLDLGRLCLAEGAWEEAARYLEEGVAIAVRSGDLQALRVAQSRLAEHDVLAGHPAAACARLLPLCDRAGLEEGSVTTFLLPCLAWAYLARGDVGHAAEIVVQALQRTRGKNEHVALVDALRVQAMVAVRQAQWAQAVQVLEEGLALAQRMPYPYAEGRLLQVYGEMHRQKGAPGPARERLEAALAIFSRLGARKDAELTEQALTALSGTPPGDASLQPLAALSTRQALEAASPAGPRLSRPERHTWALARLQADGSLSPRAYAQALAVSVDTALLDLRELMERGLVRAEGTTRNRRYVLVCDQRS